MQCKGANVPGKYPLANGRRYGVREEMPSSLPPWVQPCQARFLGLPGTQQEAALVAHSPIACGDEPCPPLLHAPSFHALALGFSFQCAFRAPPLDHQEGNVPLRKNQSFGILVTSFPPLTGAGSILPWSPGGRNDALGDSHFQSQDRGHKQQIGKNW